MKVKTKHRTQKAARADAPRGTEWRKSNRFGYWEIIDTETGERLGHVHSTRHSTNGKLNGWAYAYCKLIRNVYEASRLCPNKIAAFERVNRQVADERGSA